MVDGSVSLLLLRIRIPGVNSISQRSGFFAISVQRGAPSANADARYSFRGASRSCFEYIRVLGRDLVDSLVSYLSQIFHCVDLKGCLTHAEGIRGMCGYYSAVEDSNDW